MAPEHDISGSESSDESITGPLDVTKEDGWKDVENDEEQIAVTSLFNNQKFPNAKQMLLDCKQNHNFDIWELRQKYDLEYFDLIKLVNFVRAEVKFGNVKSDISDKTIFEDDKYLRPVLEDDALLYSLDDIFDDQVGSGVVSEVDELREQLETLQAQFSAYRQEVQAAMLSKLEDAPTSSSSTNKTDANPNTKASDREDGYFTSYSYNAIHESMLKDTIRTNSYRDFIYENKHLFAGKTVLDVGCGTGILSMFCAKAGAKLVIAVDNSDIISKAIENVFINGFQDTIKCIRGKIEEVQLPVEKVNIIVSEWMGYGLLYECMLDSVLYARDKFLVEDGLMVPSNACLKISPLADSDLREDYISFWHNVYGFDMSAMLERAYEEALVRIVVPRDIACSKDAKTSLKTGDKKSHPGSASDFAPAEDTSTKKELCLPQTFLSLDLHKTNVSELDFTAPFSIPWPSIHAEKPLEGFVIWFDMDFCTSQDESKILAQIQSQNLTTSSLTSADIPKPKGTRISFSTGPFSTATHWQQVVLLIKDPLEPVTAVAAGEGQTIQGTVKYVKKVDAARSLDIQLEWSLGKPSGKGAVNEKSQKWVLD